MPKKKAIKKWVAKTEKEALLNEKNEKEKLAGEEDDDIYDKEEREEQMEENEISPGEAGFVEGYEDTEVVECGSCKGEIDWDKAVEREINGKTYIFCSKKCSDSFEKRKALD